MRDLSFSISFPQPNHSQRSTTQELGRGSGPTPNKKRDWVEHSLAWKGRATFRAFGGGDAAEEGGFSPHDMAEGREANSTEDSLHAPPMDAAGDVPCKWGDHGHGR